MKLKHIAAAGLGALLFGCGGGDGSGGGNCRIELDGALKGSVPCVSEFMEGQLFLRPAYEDQKPVGVLIAQFGSDGPQAGVTYTKQNADNLTVAADPEDEEDRAFVALVGKGMMIQYGDVELTLSTVAGEEMHGTFFATLVCVADEGSSCIPGEEVEASGMF